MSILEAVLLGIVQGATEFLPVSSSGHLVLAQKVLAISEPSLTFDLFLHFATMLAVIIFFWRELLRLRFADLSKIVLASIPAGVIGVFFEDSLTELFSSTLFVGCALLYTAGILYWADTRLTKKSSSSAAVGSDQRSVPATKDTAAAAKSSLPTVSPTTSVLGQLTYRQAIVVGMFQAVALLPGVSRSGSTVAGGILSGVPRQTAFQFSFLMVLPVIAGASLLQFIKLLDGGLAEIAPLPYLFGGVVAATVGLLSLGVLKYIITKSRLEVFALYTAVVGVIAIVTSLYN